MEKAKILLIQDNPDDVFLAKHALSKLNLRNVDIVNGGIEALQYLFGEDPGSQDAPIINKPDIILLDQKMPLLDGLQFMEYAYDALQAHNIRVIVTTSSSIEDEKKRFNELGVKNYIEKPVNVEGLLQSNTTELH